MSQLIEKLSQIAQDIAKELGTLHLMALVRRENSPDRWDLLVSADKLEPRSLAATRYIDKHLKSRLTPSEKLMIATIVPLPRENKVVAWLIEEGQSPPRNLRGQHPNDYVEESIVIWPKKSAARRARAG